MITLTPAAAQQVRRAAVDFGEGAVLRVAARELADGTVDYGMGFDEWREGDMRVLCEGVAVVVAPSSRRLLERVTVDYVELSPGDPRFVFMAREARATEAP